MSKRTKAKRRRLLPHRYRGTRKELLAEIDRLVRELEQANRGIEAWEKIADGAKQEAQHLAAAHEYAYGSLERLGHIRRLEAELAGMRQRAMAPSAAWGGFLVSGMPESIEEVWRLIEADAARKAT